MRAWVKLALGAGLLTGGAAVFNEWACWNVAPVKRCLEGEPHFYQWRDGAIYYEVAGPPDGPPLLLLHGINAAASSCEMQAIFLPLAAKGFRVYLPDLLGYGRSERPHLTYTADTYVDLWSDFTRDVVLAGSGQPPHALASSLSAAHLIGAAARHPERFVCLLLVCPTGIRALNNPPALPGRLVYGLLSMPIIGTALFNLLVTHVSLAAFLRRQVYAEPGHVTPPLVESQYQTSHQPGAKWAPAAFVAGYLNYGVANPLAALPNAVSLAWGAQAKVTPPDQADDFRRLRPGLAVQVFEISGLLPHQEEPEAFVRWVVKTCGIGN